MVVYRVQWGPETKFHAIMRPVRKCTREKRTGKTKLQGFALPLLFPHCKCSSEKPRLEKLKHTPPSSLLAPNGQRFAGRLQAHWMHLESTLRVAAWKGVKEQKTTRKGSPTILD